MHITSKSGACVDADYDPQLALYEATLDEVIEIIQETQQTLNQVVQEVIDGHEGATATACDAMFDYYDSGLYVYIFGAARPLGVGQ